MTAAETTPLHRNEFKLLLSCLSCLRPVIVTILLLRLYSSPLRFGLCLITVLRLITVLQQLLDRLSSAVGVDALQGILVSKE